MYECELRQRGNSNVTDSQEDRPPEYSSRVEMVEMFPFCHSTYEGTHRDLPDIGQVMERGTYWDTILIIATWNVVWHVV